MRQATFLFIDGKTCRVCGKVKSDDEFYSAPGNRDGLASKCKSCQSEYYREYSASNKKRLAEQKANWYDRNRERVIERQRSYYRDHRDAVQERINRWGEENMEKVGAGRKARRAIESGRIERQPCSQCGVAEAEAHHDDYTKPLEVRWLCRRCHRRHHASLAS